MNSILPGARCTQTYVTSTGDYLAVRI